MKGKNKITTPKHYWFSLYSEIDGSQFGFSCLAKDDEQAERKMRHECGEYVGIADYGTDE